MINSKSRPVVSARNLGARQVVSLTPSPNEEPTGGSLISAATTIRIRCAAASPTWSTLHLGCVYDSVDGFDEKDDLELFVSVAGPVIPDRLFVYGIYDYKSVDERNYSTYGRVHKDVDDTGFGIETRLAVQR